MSPFMYIVGPLLIAAILQYALTLIAPRPPVEKEDSPRDKSSKFARKDDAESGIIDNSSPVVREQARKTERAAPAAKKSAVAEPEVYDIPSDFSMDEYRSARE